MINQVLKPIEFSNKGSQVFKNGKRIESMLLEEEVTWIDERKNEEVTWKK